MQKQSPNYKCETHSQKSIQFFCTVNQWHFVPLCSECLPSHTQSHPKNMKVTIQSNTNVRQKYTKQQQNAIKLYNQKLQKINLILENPKQHNEYVMLQKYKQRVILDIDNFFKKLKETIQKRRKQVQDYQINLMKNLRQNIVNDIEELKNVEKIQNGQQWADQAKRIYFKDGAQIYVDEIQEVIQDHEQRIYGKKHIVFDEEKIKKLIADIQKNLQATFKLEPQKQEPKKQEKKNEQNKKKGPKIVIKSKICKICGGQLQYLTELKKHLVCPTCGEKQRNYMSKKQ